MKKDIKDIAERIDDLQVNNLKLIQNPNGFCFGIDAVLLADWASQIIARKRRKFSKLLDLCTGNGIVAILMSAKVEEASITGLEIQDIAYDLFKRNITLNKLEDRLKAIHGDLTRVEDYLESSAYNLVTCNPPYMVTGTGKINSKDIKAIARHEILCSFEDVARAAAFTLKVGGSLALIHRPRRLTEIMQSLKKQGLEVKRIRMVHSFVSKEASMILIEAVKGAGVELIIEPPLIVYKEDGSYTEEVRAIYEGRDVDG